MELVPPVCVTMPVPESPTYREYLLVQVEPDPSKVRVPVEPEE